MNEKKVIRVGSRESKLAVAQAGFIIEAIKKNHPELAFELVTMKTTGDKILDKSLDKIGGKGLFVKELDRALLAGQIDISVHSLKDMPTEVREDLPIVAYSQREDPRDVLILNDGITLPLTGGIIGTSSKRRKIQMEALYPGIRIEGVRGNVLSRLEKMRKEDFSGLVLAASGLKRLKLEHLIGKVFAPEEMIPAAGQGILAVQGRAGEDYAYLACVEDREGRICALSERAFIKELDGGCSSPTAAFAKVKSDRVVLKGLYYSEADQTYVTGEKEGCVQDCVSLGVTLAAELRAKKEREMV